MLKGNFHPNITSEVIPTLDLHRFIKSLFLENKMKVPTNLNIAKDGITLMPKLEQ